MPRTKGAKCNYSWAEKTKAMSIRFSPAVLDYLNTKPNKTKYITDLILDDMKKNELKEMED